MVGTHHSALASVFLTQLVILGTCVFIVQMMDVFNWAPLPGGQPRTYPKNDIATYPDILDVALALSSQCVEERSNPQAGWSLTGKSIHNSLSSKYSIYLSVDLERT